MEKEKWYKNIKKSRCHICDKPQSSTNPIATCYECKEKFCYDHIYGGQINDKMKNTDAIRDICSKCRQKHSYFTL